MRLGLVLFGLLVLLGAALASTAVVYSPDKDFGSAKMLEENGYSVKTFSQKFGLEELRDAEVLFVDAGINDIPPEMYVIFREYAVQGGKVIIALDPVSVKSYSTFDEISRIDPSLCYSEPSPTKKFQYCTETKIFGQDLVTGKAYSPISEYIGKIEAVPLESSGAPLAYVDGQETAVRNYVGQGEMIVAGFRYSPETEKFFEQLMFPGKATEQTPVQAQAENQENTGIIARPKPPETEKKITGETIAVLPGKTQEGGSIVPTVVGLVCLAGILGYFIITRPPQQKPGPKKTIKEPAKTPPSHASQTTLVDLQAQQPRITLPPKEKDEFIY